MCYIWRYTCTCICRIIVPVLKILDSVLLIFKFYVITHYTARLLLEELYFSTIECEDEPRKKKKGDIFTGIESRFKVVSKSLPSVITNESGNVTSNKDQSVEQEDEDKGIDEEENTAKVKDENEDTSNDKYEDEDEDTSKIDKNKDEGEDEVKDKEDTTKDDGEDENQEEANVVVVDDDAVMVSPADSGKKSKSTSWKICLDS